MASNAMHQELCRVEVAGLTEEELPPRSLVDDVSVRDAEDLHDTSQLLLLVFARKDRHAGIKLGEDAPGYSYSSAQLIFVSAWTRPRLHISMAMA